MGLYICVYSVDVSVFVVSVVCVCIICVCVCAHAFIISDFTSKLIKIIDS